MGRATQTSFSDMRPYRALLLNGSVSNIRTDGSSTPQVFSVSADSDQDTVITEIRIMLHGEGMHGVPGFRQFTNDNTSGLTNGLKLTLSRADTSYEWFTDGPVKTLGDFFLYHDDAFEIEDAIATDIDTVVLLFKFYNQPIWLAKGSTDKIEFTVQDDLTCLSSSKDSMVLVTGFREIV